MKSAVRREIMPGVRMTSKFKTGCLSINMLVQLNRENASKNALIPMVLRRGTARYPNMESLASVLDRLYGARIDPIVRKKGEIQCIGFYADFIDDAFAPENEHILENMAEMLGEMLTQPATSGGRLRAEYVDSERKKLIDVIESRINDKRQYAVSRLTELMCFGEDYGTDRLGTVQEAEKINNGSLTRYYKELLPSAVIEIFYCGSRSADDAERILTDALKGLPRGELNCEVGTDIRMNSVEEKPRYFEDRLDVSQGKLAIGFRLGECMYNPNYAELMVFNAIYGGGVNSKLFMNVREKLSLCYYASSMIEKHKGIMIVVSGIEFSKYQEALDEILKQLEAVKNGEITDEELSAAKKYIKNILLGYMDKQTSMEEFYLGQAIEGLTIGPADLAALVETITSEQVAAVAKGVETDAIYFLRGEDEEEFAQ